MGGTMMTLKLTAITGMSLNILWLTPLYNNKKIAATSETLEAGTGFIYQF